MLKEILSLATEEEGAIEEVVKDGYTITITHPVIVCVIVLCAVVAVLIGVILFSFLMGKKRQRKENTKISNVVTATINPLMSEISAQNQLLMQALVLAQSNDPNSKLALVNLLRAAISKDKNSITESVSKSIQDVDLAKKHIKDKALENINSVIETCSKDKPLGGVSI